MKIHTIYTGEGKSSYHVALITLQTTVDLGLVKAPDIDALRCYALLVSRKVSLDHARQPPRKITENGEQSPEDTTQGSIVFGDDSICLFSTTMSVGGSNSNMQDPNSSPYL